MRYAGQLQRYAAILGRKGSACTPPHHFRQLHPEGAVGGDLDNVVQLPCLLVAICDQLQNQQQPTTTTTTTTTTRTRGVGLTRFKAWCARRPNKRTHPSRTHTHTHTHTPHAHVALA